MSWFGGNRDVKSLETLLEANKRILAEITNRQISAEQAVMQVGKTARRVEELFKEIVAEVDHLKNYSKAYMELLDKSEKQIVKDALIKFIDKGLSQ